MIRRPPRSTLSLHDALPISYCDISFSGTPGLVIPKGTAFLTAGGLSYALMAAVALGPEGTGRGRLEAAEAGSAYNVEAGAIDRKIGRASCRERV